MKPERQKGKFLQGPHAASYSTTTTKGGLTFPIAGTAYLEAVLEWM